MIERLTRRRMIRISAAAAGLAVVPFGERAAAEGGIATWYGTALGAAATMQIHHPDRAFAQGLIERSLAEVRRLEKLFSLYRSDAEVVALNKHGALAAPAPELVELLSESQRYAALTDGAFDVTVQPLWDLCADYFSRPDAGAAGPGEDLIAAALSRVGHQSLLVNRDRIAFAKRGMAVTLNGIAQGYVTDRIVDLLRSEGITQTLVDMGETRCLGTHPSGRPWEVGIADPEASGRVRQSLPVVNQAVATSGGYGFQFDAAGHFNHLFDPGTGRSPHLYRSVTVVAPTATAADALSTAFSLMDPARIDLVLSTAGDVVAYLILPDGNVVKRSES